MPLQYHQSHISNPPDHYMGSGQAHFQGQGNKWSHQMSTASTNAHNYFHGQDQHSGNGQRLFQDYYQGNNGQYQGQGYQQGNGQMPFQNQMHSPRQGNGQRNYHGHGQYQGNGQYQGQGHQHGNRQMSYQNQMVKLWSNSIPTISP